MTTAITVLASGSKGNAILIHDKNNGILIDAGLSLKELLQKIDNAGINPGIIKAICITHAHTDHTTGVAPLAKQLTIPVYITQGTYKTAPWLDIPENQVRLFKAGESFAHAPFLIQSIEVSHDIGTPVGYIIEFNGHQIGIATDLGITDSKLIHALKGCKAIILESNYDETMLMDSKRPQFLKDRISGDKGHLSNRQCAEALQQIVTAETSDVILCHLSQDCNKPVIALKTAKGALKNHQQINLITASQDKINTVKLF
jgi:phosphoribosyl 1,2-cyclic phosphodiesterase